LLRPVRAKTSLMSLRGLPAVGLAFVLLLLGLRGPLLLKSAAANGGYSLFNLAHTDRSARLLHQGEDWRLLGHLYVVQNEDDTAVAYWRAAADPMAMRQELYAWALVEARWGQPDGALRWYERAISLHPETADTWYFAGRLLEEEGDVETAVVYYQAALNTGRFEEVGVSDIALRLGLLAFARQEWPLVDHWLDLAINEPTFRVENRAWEARYTRAESWRLRHNLALAAPDYQWVVDHNPNHYWAHIRLAQVYWQLENDADRSEELLIQAIRIDPNRKWAYRARGDLYRETMRPAEAITMYRQVLLLDPDDAVVTQYLQALDDNGH
jgi:tetratricopeptide (TPR) repeat protein